MMTVVLGEVADRPVFSSGVGVCDRVRAVFSRQFRSAGMQRLVLAVIATMALLLAGYLLMRLPSRAPLVLGYISSLSGRFSALSGAGRDGAVLAVEHVNAGGGIDGRALRLDMEDDAFDPDTARQAVIHLKALGAVAIVGPFASAVTRSLVDTAQEQGMLVVSPTVTSDDFNSQDDLFLRVIPAADSFATALGSYCGATRALKTVSLLADKANASYSDGVIRSFSRGFLASGGRDVIVIEYDSRLSPSFQELAAKALALRPDGVMLVSSPLDTALMCQRLRILEPAVPVFSSAWGMSGEMVQSGGRAVEGIVSVVPFNPDSRDPAYLDFVAAFKERFGKSPDFSSMFNYEAVMLLVAALDSDAGARGEALKRIILDRKTYRGLQGEYTLNGFGDVSRPLYLLTVADGRLRLKE
jgi:branched-chain amino acid transport system substrate-binding protein